MHFILSLTRRGQRKLFRQISLKLFRSSDQSPVALSLTKRQRGAFYGTELYLQLHCHGITTIILCGISTNIGVESAACFAHEFDYNQIFAEDAISAITEGEYNFSVIKNFPTYGTGSQNDGDSGRHFGNLIFTKTFSHFVANLLYD